MNSFISPRLRKVRAFLLLVAALSCLPRSVYAVDYFYQAGDPAMTASWNTLLGGGGANPPGFTTMTDRFLIPAGRTATMLSNLNFGANVLLQVQNGGTLNTATFIFTGAGDFELLAGSTLITANTNGVNGGCLQNTGARTFAPTANYTFNAAAATQNAGFNIVVPIFAAQNITVNNQNLPTAGAFVMDNGITLSGTLTVQRGTFDCGTALNQTFSGGTNTVVVAPGAVFLRRDGNVTAAAGTFQYQTGAPNSQLQYVFTGTIASGGELPTNMPGDVNVTANTTLQLSASVSVNGALTATGSLNLAGQTWSQNGAMTLDAASITDLNGGGFTWVGPITFVAGCAITDNSGGGGGTITLAGTGAITGSFIWQAGISNLGTLTMNRAGATLRCSSNLPISNLLSLQNGFLIASQVNIETLSLSAVQGGSATSFVAGKLLRRVGANQNPSQLFNFPVGKGSNYLPISFNDAVTGPGSPGIVVEAFNGLTTGILGANVSSLSNYYWQIQPAAIGDFSQMALRVQRDNPPLLVATSVLTGANSTSGTFSQIPSASVGNLLTTNRFAVSVVGPQFFAVGNATPVPVITSFSPVTGGTGTVATITGLNFSNALSVSFGGIPAQSFQVLNPNQIVATVGAGATGPISITTIGGTGMSSSTFAYTPAPQLTAVTPSAGGFNTILSLRGRNLSSTNSVSVGGNLLSVIFRSDTLIQVRMPNRDVSGAIRLGTPGGLATTTTTFSWLLPPVISGFSPIVGTLRDVVVITGANFSIISNITIGGTSAQSWTINSPTQVSAVLLNGSTGNIVIRTPAGDATSATIFFYAQRPSLRSAHFNDIQTNTAIAGSTLLLRGQDLLFTTRASVGNITAAVVSVLSSTEVTVRLPISAVTVGTLSISTPGGTANLPMPFSVLPALTITDVSPTFGTSGSLVRIRGTAFTTDATVSIAGTNASSVVVLSTTEILAVVGALPPRTTRGAIVVSSTVGTASTSSQFVVTAVQPVIAAISPLNATQGSLVQIRGQFLTGVREVSIGGGRAEIVQSVSANELLVRVTRFATTGTVSLTTLGGTTTSTVRLTVIPSPFILSFSPPFAVTGSTITLRGTNFTGTRLVFFGNTSARSFSVLSDSVMTAVVGTGSTGVIRISGDRGVAQSTGELRVISQLDYETEILRVFYDSLGGVAWNNRATNRWFSGDPPSEWAGVTIENGRVTRLRLPDNNLRGRLPELLAELSALKILDLTDNAISGVFPDWILRLPSLEEVRLGGNQFTGTLPDSIGSLSNLRVLVCDRNRLTGALPNSLCSLLNLRELNINQNSITGEILPCLGTLRNLQILDLGQNQFVGTIPPELGDLTNLQSLYLHRNRLQGSIPDNFGNATVATLIAKAKPGEFAELSATNNLRRLWLGGNQLTGEVPDALRSLTALEELLLENNQLSGDTVLRVISALRNLQTLDIGRNRFTGVLPQTIGSLRRLRFLSLRNNQFSGTLPATLSSLDTLQTLLLDSNQFIGTVPSQLSGLRSIQTLGLSFNQFTSLPRMSALLSVLAVQGNRLQFGDLLTNAAVADFTYAPQDSIGIARDTGIVIGNPMLLQVNVSGRDNLYQWFKNGREIQATSATVGFRIEQFTPQDTGVYICAITNRLIDRLTLVSRPVRVIGLPPKPPSQSPDLVFPQSGATFVAFAPTMQWTRVDNAILYEVQVSQLRDFALLATTASVRSADTSLSTISARIDGLEPLTLYYWRVRALNGIGVASQWSSANSFITAPPGVSVSLSSINFGNVVLGETASGTAFLTNLTDKNLVIADIDGNDAEFSFRIPLDVRSLRLNAGQTVSIRGVTFAPRSPGNKSANARITYIDPANPLDTLSIRLENVLQGRGTPIKAEPVFFDTIRVGTLAQTIGLIANRGGTATRVIISGVQIIGNPNGFSVDTLARPLVINSGAVSSVAVRCQPINEGTISATLRYFARFIQTQGGMETVFFDTLNTTLTAVARAQDPFRDIPVSIGVRPARNQNTAAPGTSVTMEVFLAGISQEGLDSLIFVKPLTYSAVIRFNRQVLALGNNPLPIRALPNPAVENNLQRFSVTSATITESGIRTLVRDSVIFRFTCIAVAGDTSQTPIEIEYFRFGVDTLPSASVPQPFASGQRRIFVEELIVGNFRTLLSRAGGIRLITRTPSTNATLSAIAPNPVADAGLVRFTVFEPSPVELVLVDIFGKVLKVLADYPLASGEYSATVPMNDVPTGTYFVMLRTPRAILTERVQVRR